MKESRRELLSWLPVLAGAAVVASLGPANFWAFAIGTLGAALVCFQYVGWRVAVAACCVVAVGLWRASEAEADYRRQLLLVAEQFKHPVRCEIVAALSSQPQWHNTSLSFIAEIESADCETATLPRATRIRLYGGPADLARGDRFAATTELSVVQLFRNQDVVSPFWQAARTGATLSGGLLRLDRISRGDELSAGIDRLRATIRERIEATYVPVAVPMAKALVLGESDLSAEEDGAFKASGLSHLLAVSGTHLVIAVGTTVAFLRALFLRLPALSMRWDVQRCASLLGMPIALFYADFAGGSGSALRSAWMLCFVYLWTALGRKASATQSLAASALVAVMRDPLAGFDISLMLSLAATLGLIRVNPLFQGCLSRVAHPGARLFLAGIATTLSAMAPCSCVLALLSAEVSLVGILANAVAAPFGETIALPLCLAHTLASSVPLLEQGLALVASGALLVVRRVALFSAAHRFASVPLLLPSAWHYAALGWALSSWLIGTSRSKRTKALSYAISALALGVAEFVAQRAGHPHSELRVTALDVGQGDATLVDLPHGCLMLIDGGGFVGSPVDPGERVILPALRARRRTRVDVVVLSHPHPDHFIGLQSVLEKVEVGELWDTGQGERWGAGPVYSKLLSTARARGIPIRRPAELCGERAWCGAALDVMAPCPEPVEGRGANDNSFVFKLKYQKRAALFVGDAEAAEERELMAASGSHLRSDMLKVGHHGSRTSSSDEFVTAVAPTFATLSCGMRNHFGHPHLEALDRLSQVPTLWRTDLRGSGTWSTDGAVCTFSGFEACQPVLLDTGQ